MKIEASKRLAANIKVSDYVLNEDGRVGRVSTIHGDSAEVLYSGGLRSLTRVSDIKTSKHNDFKPSTAEAKALFNRRYKETHKDSKGTLGSDKFFLGNRGAGVEYIFESDFASDPKLIFDTMAVYERNGKYL